jgi:hypothetical protein
VQSIQLKAKMIAEQKPPDENWHKSHHEPKRSRAFRLSASPADGKAAADHQQYPNCDDGYENTKD